MFPLSFPTRQLSGVKSDEWVLDPFCGRGSTNYAARLLGLPSVGIDSNPVAAAIAEGKMVETSVEAVGNACRDILASTAPVESPEGEFWDLCYHSRTLADLVRVRAVLLQSCEAPERKALCALMLGLLHGPLTKGAPSYLSNQMPRTYAAKPDYAVRFWRKRNLAPRYVDLQDLVQRKAQHYFTNTPRHAPFRVICGDSRNLDLTSLGCRFSRVITSPPYYGMRTYVPDQWLRYWFLGGPPEVTYRHPDQMAHGSPDAFSAQLAAVLKNVARSCVAGARLVIRFGGIHDRNVNPREIMLTALRQADCGLRPLTIRSAGSSLHGKRQADQFKRKLGKPIEELDFHLRLGQELT
jgi:hypothetical protein